VAEKLHAHQGGAEVQVHVLNPKQPVGVGASFG
jgi:hypothetical protein